MNDDARAFDMAQELVPESDSRMGAFDQSRQVGQNEGTLATDMDDAKVGMFGRERIGADFRLGLRQPAEERRLTGIGEADQAAIGNDLQLQDQPAFFPVG